MKTPMDAWAAGKPLLIWPYAAEDPRLRFLMAGYSRLPKGDVFFTDTWNDPTFGGHSAHLLDGHAEKIGEVTWRAGEAVIEVVDEPPFDEQAALIYNHNKKHGGTQARFDEMAARLFGNGNREVED